MEKFTTIQEIEIHWGYMIMILEVYDNNDPGGI